MSNRVRITLTAFLAYAVMAGMLAQIGIMINPMAEHYGQQATDVANQFSWLTVGILVGSVISLGIFDFITIRTLNLATFSGVIIAISGFFFLDAYAANAILMGLIGISCGIMLPAAAVVISRTYEPNRRATMLVITDASFSISGAVCSALAVSYLAANLHWSTGYSSVALIALLALVLILASTFPEVGEEEKKDPLTELRQWPLSVYLCMLALLVYLVGQNFILIWLPSYALGLDGASSDQAGRLVSNFWAGMFVGQLIAAAILLTVRASSLALVSAGFALLATIPLWVVLDIEILGYMTFIWGIVTLGLLKLILSWATEMVAVPSPRLISVLLMAATMGTAISPSVSSSLVAATSFRAALQAGSLCFLTVLILVFLARYFRNNV